MSRTRKSYGSIVAHLAVESSTSTSNRLTNIPILTCALLVSLTTGGPTYAFGLYGSTLKRTLNLSQLELETISSAYFCAGLFSWIPGLCVDKFGPKASMAAGGILGCVSLSLYWVVARQFLEISRSLIVPTLSLNGIAIFMSNSLVIGSLFKALMLSCGGSRGQAVGAAKAYVGLGSGTYSCLFEAVRGKNESELDFLLICGFFAVLAGTFPALTLLPTKEQLKQHIVDVSTPLHYKLLYTGLIILATVVLWTSIVSLLTTPGGINDEHPGPNFARASLLLLAWFGPIISLLFLPRSTHDYVETGYETQICALEATPDSLLPSDADSTEPSSLPPENLSLFQMIQTRAAALLLGSSVILVGSGTILANNMGQMVEALHFPSTVGSASLALFSVAQAGARVVTGATSESALRWNTSLFGIDKGIPRPVFLVLASLIGAMAHVVLALAVTRGLFVCGVILEGIAFGMTWPLMVLIVGEVFGTANHGTNYMFFDGVTSAMGTLLISKFIAQEVYESNISLEDDEADGITCYGSACFRASHIITSVLCLTCVATSIGLVAVTRGVYGRPSTH